MKRFAILSLLIASFFNVNSQENKETVALIPVPASMQPGHVLTPMPE
jgi:hypothetical protein